jgi:hypothetical protein
MILHGVDCAECLMVNGRLSLRSEDMVYGMHVHDDNGWNDGLDGELNELAHQPNQVEFR